MTPRVAPVERTIALVGLMGVGKTSVGRRLAKALGMPFRDADQEIERAAARPVSEIFAQFGQAGFRAGERKVIARLLREPPHVLATGGGAFMDPQTRSLLKQEALTVWLRADIDVLAARVSRRNTRPLLQGRDPHVVLSEMMQVRHPVYAEADVVVETGYDSHATAVDAIIAAIQTWVGTPA